MVRHEAAEALGGIIEEEIEEGNLNPNLKDTSTEVTIGDGEKALNQLEREEKQLIKNAIETLRDFSKDMELPRVVRESCVVALDEMACEFLSFLFLSFFLFRVFFFPIAFLQLFPPSSLLNLLHFSPHQITTTQLNFIV